MGIYIMNKLKKLYTIVAIISGIVICVIFLYSIKSNALHYKVNCFNDTTKVNAMSVYYNNNYYYVDKNKKIYKLSSDNENKCLISENYISGISVLGNYIYYISTEKLFRYNIETEFVELLDNECGYMYISSDNKYIYALRYINANYTNYRLLKINDNEKYEFATEDSDVDKDIAEDAQDKETAEAVLRLDPAHSRRLLGIGGQAAGVHEPRRHHGAQEVPKPDHRQLQGVVPPILEDVADLAGKELQPEGTDAEEPAGEEEGPQHLALQRQEDHPAEADAHSGQHGGEKGFQVSHASSFRSAASITWRRRTEVVTQPTPPGTGVMAATMGSTSS